MSLPPLEAEHERRFGTTDERQVLALEKIADQLELLACHLIGSRRLPHGAEADPAREADGTANDAPDDPRPFDAAMPEIDRTLVEHFAVDGYRYTDLQHAIAQAKRARAAQSIAEDATRQEH